MSETKVMYNIGFINSDGREDETQFDVCEDTAAEELESLFADFCEENHCDPGKRLYTEYAGPAI